MTILAIDTTSDEIRVGLLSGEKVTTQTSPARPHSRRLFPIIAKILAGQKPDAVAVSVGPGSYTGTRVGVVTANTLSWAWKLPVYGIEKKEAPTIEEVLQKGRERFTQGDHSSLAKPLYSSVVE